MFFKNKKIKLNCYTSEQYVYDYFKIDYASKFVPSWWKELPKSYTKEGRLGSSATMKTCTGFTRYYQNGLMMPLWNDLAIHVGTSEQGMYGYEFSDNQNEIQMHPPVQRGTYLSEQDYIHMKIKSPWIFVCEEDIDWMFIKPDWNFDKPEEIIMPPATVDFKYQHTTHINFFLKFNSNIQNIFVNSGSPLVHVIPLSERKIELNVQKISSEDMKDFRSKQQKISFTDKYSKIKRIVNRQEEAKCPFSFFKK